MLRFEENSMNRKLVVRLFLCWTIFSLCLFASGCTSNWVSEATNIINLLVPAIEAVLGILAAVGVSAGLTTSVVADVTKWANEATNTLTTVVKPLIDQYNTAEAAAQPGILTEIQTALNVISNNLASILPAIHVTNADTQAKITAVVTAVADEISALIGLIPAISGKVTSHEELKQLMSALKSPKEFRADFNAKAEVFGKQYTI
jgi:hypothetical protein